ncbi:hypothetical protein D1872_345860 [compost metagenome]
MLIVTGLESSVAAPLPAPALFAPLFAALLLPPHADNRPISSTRLNDKARIFFFIN